MITTKRMNRLMSLLGLAFCLSLLLTAFDAAFAHRGSGFSESTLSILNKMILERIHSDPKILEHATRALIERQLALESREPDPALVTLITERILYARANIPQPRVNPNTTIPEIVIFRSGSDIAMLGKIKKVLDSAVKPEILNFYFKLEKGTESWSYVNVSRGQVDFTDLEVLVPVNTLNVNDDPEQHQYVAKFRITHPPETWEFDDNKNSADLVIRDPAQIEFISFSNGRDPVLDECDDLLKRLKRPARF